MCFEICWRTNTPKQRRQLGNLEGRLSSSQIYLVSTSKFPSQKRGEQISWDFATSDSSEGRGYWVTWIHSWNMPTVFQNNSNGKRKTREWTQWHKCHLVIGLCVLSAWTQLYCVGSEATQVPLTTVLCQQCGIMRGLKMPPSLRWWKPSEQQWEP